MKIVLSPEYEYLKDFFEKIPENFETGGETIYQGRNIIKNFSVNGKELVIKSFKIPHLINKIVYAYIRQSKARRSYENGMDLMKKGFQTPCPIGYIEIRKNGLFDKSYYISEKSRFNREFRDISDLPQTEETLPVVTEFARFTAQLHEKNIFHKDYTPGNILFGKQGEGYGFELVDINRMKFCEVDMVSGCKNLRNLYITDDLFSVLAKTYAQARKFDPNRCEELILKYRSPK